jgi:hypothetical protein
MTYGIQVINKNNNIIFSTTDDWPIFTAGTPVSTTANSSELPDLSTGQLLLARTQDGESGVIAAQRYQKQDPGTSSTSRSVISSGSISFFVSGAVYSVDDEIVVSVSSNSSIFMRGIVTSFSSNVVTISVTSSAGSGTYNSWSLDYPFDATNAYIRRYGNSTTFENAFGCASGYKYIVASRGYDNFTPAGTGYGIEAYDSTGNNLLFSSNMTNLLNIEAVVTVPRGSAFRFTNPYNRAFNNLYIDMYNTDIQDSVNLYFGPFIGGGEHVVAGAYAYFDHVNEDIWLCNSYHSDPNVNATWAWDDFLYEQDDSLVDHTFIIYSIT